MAASTSGRLKVDAAGQNIKVVVRVRPLNNEEREKKGQNIIKCLSSTEIQIKEKKYRFDKVFLPNSSQIDIYTNVIDPMISDVLAGYNCVVFAYGSTGTGKTYTMTGANPDLNFSTHWKEDVSAGCIPRAAAHVFNEIASRNVIDYNVRVSFLELYNEEVRDLLSSNEEDSSFLSIFNDSKGSVYIQGLNEITVFNSRDINMLFQQGTNKRQTATTLINNHSSRSHTVFTITVHSKEINENGGEVLKTGKISLVDLAGSENMAKSGAKDKRAQESGNINKSLLTLSRVIQILAEKSNTHKHVPYRESKLTRILQDSLGGSTETCIIATISPSHLSFEETQSTLEYACRARDIKNTPIINANVTKAAVVQNMNKEIEKLKRDLEAAMFTDGIFINKSNWEELNSDIARNSTDLIQKTEIINEMKTKLAQLERMRETKIKEFDQIMNICRKNEKIIDKAKNILKDTMQSLRQEEYVSSCYENAISKTSQKASKLMESTKILLDKHKSLHNKLENQYSSNCRNVKILKEKSTDLEQNLTAILDNAENIEKTSKEELNNQRLLINSAKESCIKSVQGMTSTYTNEISALESKYDVFANNMDSVNTQVESHICDRVNEIVEVTNNTEVISDLNKDAIRNFERYHQVQSSTIKSKINFLKETYSLICAERQKEKLVLDDLLRIANLKKSRIKKLDGIISSLSDAFNKHKQAEAEMLQHKTVIEDNLIKIQENIETNLDRIHTGKELLETFSTEFSTDATEILENSGKLKTNVTKILEKKIEEFKSVAENINSKLNDVKDTAESLENSITNHSSKIKDSLNTIQPKIPENIVTVRRTGDTPLASEKICNLKRSSEILSRTDLLNRFQEENGEVGEFHTLEDVNISTNSVQSLQIADNSEFE